MSAREKVGRFVTVALAIIIAWQTFLAVGHVMGVSSDQAYRLQTLDNPKSLIPIEDRENYEVLTEDRVGFSNIIFVAACGVAAMTIPLLIGRLIANSRFGKRQTRWLWKTMTLLAIWWAITRILEAFIADPGAALLVGFLGWLVIYAGCCIIVSLRRRRLGDETTSSSDRSTQSSLPHL